MEAIHPDPAHSFRHWSKVHNDFEVWDCEMSIKFVVFGSWVQNISIRNHHPKKHYPNTQFYTKTMQTIQIINALHSSTPRPTAANKTPGSGCSGSIICISRRATWHADERPHSSPIAPNELNTSWKSAHTPSMTNATICPGWPINLAHEATQPPKKKTCLLWQNTFSKQIAFSYVVVLKFLNKRFFNTHLVEYLPCYLQDWYFSSPHKNMGVEMIGGGLGRVFSSTNLPGNPFSTNWSGISGKSLYNLGCANGSFLESRLWRFHMAFSAKVIGHPLLDTKNPFQNHVVENCVNEFVKNCMSAASSSVPLLLPLSWQLLRFNLLHPDLICRFGNHASTLKYGSIWK